MKTPAEVFTPRASEVNKEMYVPRPDLERAILMGIQSRLHIVVNGESGCGKTWLYKSVFDQNQIYFCMVNLATASLRSDLMASFEDARRRLRPEEKIKKTKQKTISYDIKILKGERRTTEEKVDALDSFEALLSDVRGKAGFSAAFVVLDNFETILENTTLMKQVSDVIVLLDDDNYSKFNVRMLIVGTPDNIQHYIAKVSNISTISNRLRQIPEVARLTREQGLELLQRGLVKELGYEIENEGNLFDHILWVTDRIPQHVQEYCLALSEEAEQNGRKINSNLLDISDASWVKTSLLSDYTLIEKAMNSKETAASRRNQIIYCLGKCEKEDFKYGDIDHLVRREFPDSTKGVTLNISGGLSELAKRESNIIRRTPAGDAYRFTSPKYKMCIRAMLIKTQEGKIQKKSRSTLEN